MRSGQSIVIALLASTFWLVPMSVIAQVEPNGFLILSGKDPLRPEIKGVQCTGSGTISCKVASVEVCATKNEKVSGTLKLCGFPLNSPLNPSVAVYGVAGKNTCYWVWHDGVMYKFGQC